MRTEAHTGKMPVREMPPVIMAAEGDVEREPDVIEPVDRMPNADYCDALAFMDEPVTVRLEPSSEKFAPRHLPFWVNGIARWLTVGQNETVKRSYVEVIARAQPVDIQTRVGNPGDERPDNVVERYRRCKYPFSVVQDTPKGHDWLRRIMQEG